MSRNKARAGQAAEPGQDREGLLRAMMAGAGGDETMEQYKRERDERQFLTGAMEQIMRQANEAGMDLSGDAQDLAKFHSANLNKQRAIVSGLASRMKQWQDQAAQKDVAGLAQVLQGRLAEPVTTREDQENYWSSTRNEMPNMPATGKRELNVQDIVAALAQHPRAATAPHVSDLLGVILRTQAQQTMDPQEQARMALWKRQLDLQERNLQSQGDGTGPVTARPVIGGDGDVIGNLVGSRFVAKGKPKLSPGEQREKDVKGMLARNAQREIDTYTGEIEKGNKKPGPDWWPFGETYQDKAAKASERKAQLEREAEAIGEDKGEKTGDLYSDFEKFRAKKKKK